MTERIDVVVDGMHCDHCEVTVGRALERAGLRNVEVDWRAGTASGTADHFDPQVAADEVAAAGYALSEIHKRESSGSAERASSGDRPEAAAGHGSGTAGETEYDLLVIGGGSAAFAAAIKARELGARVAIVERDTMGGTCVNIGCVPSKALLRAAEHYWRAGHSPFAGVVTSAGEVDFPALVAQKQQLVERLRQEKYGDVAAFYGIDLIEGKARFVDEQTVAIDGTPMQASRYLVATGAAPWVPPVDGLEASGYITSTEALSLAEVPAELMVVGANAIGLELGQLFLHLGSRVTFVEALDRIAPFEEPEISAALQAILESRGAAFHTGARAVRAGADGDRRWLEIEANGSTIRLSGDQLLMATGRRARTDGLGLEAAGVEVDGRGHVVVDSRLQTTNPRVFAAGDVTNHPQFVYVAALGGNIAAENALRGSSRRIDFTAMPRVTFTSPPIASVGLTEAQARDTGSPVVASILPLDVVPRALVDHETDGLVKLVADEATGRLLGAHLLADGAGDVIQAAVMAIEHRATIDEIASTYHPYLTMAEGLKLAAQSFGKDVKALSCCAA